MSERQIALFKMIESEGELVFACGPRGVVANIVGHFKVQKNHHDEYQLDMGDGTSHVHIDWMRIKRFEVSLIHGEGLLIFFDDNEPLFRLYRVSGPYSDNITKVSGVLTELSS